MAVVIHYLWHRRVFVSDLLCSAMDLTGCKLFDLCLELLKSRIESSWTPSAPVGELDEEVRVVITAAVT